MWKKNWKKYGTMITAAGCLTAAGLTYGLGRSQAVPDTEAVSAAAWDESKPREESEIRDESDLRGKMEFWDDEILTDPSATAKNGPEAEPPRATVYVHICGAVAEPGVYALPEESRVIDAVEAAGGLLADAAEEAVNLAEKVTDGMQIVILDQEEADAEAKQEAERTAGLVNLNTATKEQLMELPGIGESRADDILRYRESVGGFRTIEEIMQVPGIKDAGFQKIKDRITV